MSDYPKSVQANFQSVSCISSTNISLPDYVRVIITTDANGRMRELLIPAALDLDRPKRPRTTFQDWQIHAMEVEFQKNAFLTEENRLNLAKSLGITETQVKVWFQNRRTKARKTKC